MREKWRSNRYIICFLSLSPTPSLLSAGVRNIYSPYPPLNFCLFVQRSPFLLSLAAPTFWSPWNGFQASRFPVPSPSPQSTPQGKISHPRSSDSVKLASRRGFSFTWLIKVCNSAIPSRCSVVFFCPLLSSSKNGIPAPPPSESRTQKGKLGIQGHITDDAAVSKRYGVGSERKEALKEAGKRQRRWRNLGPGFQARCQDVCVARRVVLGI